MSGLLASAADRTLEAWRPIALAFSPLFGAVVGSFLNVCIYRLPRKGLTVTRPRRSFCPSCGTSLASYDNVPLVSWLLLRGRCRHCQAPISFRYFAVEALTAALFFAIARRWLLEGEASAGASVATAALASAAVVAAFIDLDLRIIPDEITLRGILLVPPLALLVPDLQGPRPEANVALALAEAARVLEPLASAVPAWIRSGPGLAVAAGACAAGLYVLASRLEAAASRRRRRSEPPPWHERRFWGWLAGSSGGVFAVGALRPEWLFEPRIQSFWAAMWGMAVGASLVFAIGVAGSWVFRKPAMGLGDVKLMALLGAFTGWVGVVEGFFLACFLGALVGMPILVRAKLRSPREPCYVPFGPFLALGCMVIVLWPSALEGAFRWYVGLFR